MNDELQASKYSLVQVPPTASQIKQTAPKFPIELRDPWVVWEYTACLFTGDIKLKTEHLHDAIKAHAEHQNLPINVYYDPKAHWVIEDAITSNVDGDFRARVTMDLKKDNSPYSDMKFITGIDYFGECWGNFQMMMVIQPELLERPPKPVIPNPLLPTEALFVLVVVAISLIVIGNDGIKMLGWLGLFGGLIMWAISSQNVREAQQKYEKWKDEIAKIELKEIDLKRNRLSRSFKSDDLFVFHEVASKIVASVVFNALIKTGGRVQQSNENNRIEQVIPNSKKDIFDDF